MIFAAFAVVSLFLSVCAQSQLPPIFIGSGAPQHDDIHHMLMTNFIDAKPVVGFLNDFLPVCNSKEQGCCCFRPHPDQDVKPVPKPQPANTTNDAEIRRLHDELEQLSDQTKQMYADKMRQAEEVNRLRDELKLSLRNTNTLQNGLHAHEEELMKLWRTMKEKSELNAIDQASVKKLIGIVERLQTLMTGINDGHNKADSVKNTVKSAKSIVPPLI